jgi:hypothetical protein
MERNILPKTKTIAKKHKVDLAIPNLKGSGIGNVLVYTRLVEEYSRKLGKPITILTGPLDPSIGKVDNEDPFAIWRNNPFIERIVDGSKFEEDLIIINTEENELIQLNHIIENICWAYGLKPRELRSCIYLTYEEKQWALRALEGLNRPLVCLHPGGNTKSSINSPWHKKNWHVLINILKNEFGFFQVGRTEFGDYDLGLKNPAVKLRETMALIWASDFYVGFDSSPMHMATAFKKPTICLVDMRRKFEAERQFSDLHIPSVTLRWLYPFNRNIALMENDYDQESLQAVINQLSMYKTELY